MKGRKRAGPQHAEHVSEVAAGAHADVFEDVGKDPTAFDHSLLQHHQIFFQEDQIGRFLGDIDRRIHGDPHVGGPQRRGIVDPVPHEAHHMPPALKGFDDALLMGR